MKTKKILKILFMMSFLGALNAKNIEIKAEHFFGSQKSLKTTLEKNVFVKSQEGILKCDILDIYYDKNQKPIKYEASGNLSFDINIKNSNFKGFAQKLIYTADNETYTMLGNVIINQDNKNIHADKIVFNAKTGEYTLSSQKKSSPVILKFEIGK